MCFRFLRRSERWTSSWVHWKGCFLCCCFCMILFWYWYLTFFVLALFGRVLALMALLLWETDRNQVCICISFALFLALSFKVGEIFWTSFALWTLQLLSDHLTTFILCLVVSIGGYCWGVWFFERTHETNKFFDLLLHFQDNWCMFLFYLNHRTLDLFT